MSETEQNTTAEQQQAPEGEFRAITTQEQLNHVVGERLARERAKYADYDELKTKAAKLDELEEASRSELDKANARAEKAERALEAAERAARQVQIATAKGLPAELATRLAGATVEEMEADADKLAALLAPAKTSHPAQGARDGDAPSGDFLRTAFTQRLT